MKYIDGVKKILHCQLIITVNKLIIFDFYFNSFKSNTIIESLWCSESIKHFTRTIYNNSTLNLLYNISLNITKSGWGHEDNNCLRSSKTFKAYESVNIKVFGIQHHVQLEKMFTLPWNQSKHFEILNQKVLATDSTKQTYRKQ